MDIESYIKLLKGNRNNNKVSVVLYDPHFECHYFIYKINKLKDECTVAATIFFPKEGASPSGFVDIDCLAMSDLNDRFEDCIIEETSEYIGLNYKEVERRLIQQQQA